MVIENGTRVFYWSSFYKQGTVRGADIWTFGDEPPVTWYVVENDRGVMWPVRGDYIKPVHEIETELC